MNKLQKRHICNRLYEINRYTLAKELMKKGGKSSVQKVAGFLTELRKHGIVVTQEGKYHTFYKLESLYWTIDNIDAELGGFT